MSTGRKIILRDFPAAEGLHCSSTSVRKVLEYDGLAASEALVYGLGSGLGFFYILNEDESPARVINGRAPDLEGSFFKRTGNPLAWSGRWAPEAMARALQEGRPILAQTDLYHLPYYQPSVHFPGHGIVVTGIDLDAGEAWVTDQGFSEVQRTGLENLRLAMASTSPPLLTEPYRWAPAPVVEGDSLRRPRAFRSAIERTVGIMSGTPDGLVGLPALERFVRDLPGWRELDDAEWCARFAYQSIRKRGTDGASFRFMYADFLREAEGCLPALQSSGAAHYYIKAGQRWEALAGLLKQVFVTGDRSLFASCASAAAALLDSERAALSALKDALNGWAGVTSGAEPS